jgi:hypothetical protein
VSPSRTSIVPEALNRTIAASAVKPAAAPLATAHGIHATCGAKRRDRSAHGDRS